MDSKIDLVVIAGPTATGKTLVGIDIAKMFNGEVICADSRTVYRGMDIGTAKPTSDEQNGIKHHMIDIVNPDESFSAAKFKRLANQNIKEIQGRDKLQIMVGGTGLYVDSVIYDFEFLPVANKELREKLNKMSVTQLQQEIIKFGYPMPENINNPRYLARVIETGGMKSSHKELRKNTLIVGINPGNEVLKSRISTRMDLMLEKGLLKEIENLYKKYGWEVPGMKAPAYKAFKDYFENKISIDEAKYNFERNDYLLAKRQVTWFKRNKSIHWVINREEAVEYLTTKLNKNSYI